MRVEVNLTVNLVTGEDTPRSPSEEICGKGVPLLFLTHT